MFKLLSKESNIFSIPVYIGFLLVMVIIFNIFNVNSLNYFSTLITFGGIALGYFCFNTIGLNYQTHIPLFLYTFFIFAFYPGDLDIGIATSLLTNSIVILNLTSQNEEIRKKSVVLVGSILAINYIFLPTTWPISIFVMLHLITTSNKITLQLFRLFFGAFLIGITYLTVMYFLEFRSWNEAYFPFTNFSINSNFSQLLILIPIVLYFLAGVFNHFINFNKKSPISKFKYTFVLVFSFAQLITLILYMGNTYEYLLFMALPSSIIISRYIYFLRKTWMQEISLLIIIATLVTFKITTYF